jgi:hypothetical protein
MDSDFLTPVVSEKHAIDRQRKIRTKVTPKIQTGCSSKHGRLFPVSSSSSGSNALEGALSSEERATDVCTKIVKSFRDTLMIEKAMIVRMLYLVSKQQEALVQRIFGNEILDVDSEFREDYDKLVVGEKVHTEAYYAYCTMKIYVSRYASQTHVSSKKKTKKVKRLFDFLKADEKIHLASRVSHPNFKPAQLFSCMTLKFFFNKTVLIAPSFLEDDIARCIKTIFGEAKAELYKKERKDAIATITKGEVLSSVKLLDACRRRIADDDEDFIVENMTGVSVKQYLAGTDNDALHAHVDALQRKVRDLYANLNMVSADGEWQMAMKEGSGNAKELEDTQREVMRLKGELARVTSQLAKGESTLVSENNELRARVAVAEDIMTGSLDLSSAAHQRVTEAEQRVELLRNKVDLLEQVTGVSSEELAKERQDEASRCVGLKRFLHNSNATVDILRAEKAAAEEKAASAQAKMDDISARLRAAEKSAAEWKAQYMELFEETQKKEQREESNAVLQLQEEAKGLRQHVAELERELKTSGEKLAQKDKELADSTAACAAKAVTREHVQTQTEPEQAATPNEVIFILDDDDVLKNEDETNPSKRSK